eukprot:m.312640 g.312640  ORF g.312640 m.312640 type:complete len:130 (+) comp16404_c2_seq25:519-908(+)
MQAVPYAYRVERNPSVHACPTPSWVPLTSKATLSGSNLAATFIVLLRTSIRTGRARCNELRTGHHPVHNSTHPSQANAVALNVHEPKGARDDVNVPTDRSRPDLRHLNGLNIVAGTAQGWNGKCRLIVG